jgi:hypothetical protein
MGRNIWVTPNTYIGSGYFPHGPTPADAKLFTGRDYIVLRIENDKKMDETMITVINDEGEIWDVSNRHLRVSSIYDGDILLFKLPTF